MMKLKTSGVVFENRKQAVITMGTAKYRKALKNKDFIFYNNDSNS